MQEKESQNLINKIYTLKSGDRKREKTPGSSEISLVEIRTVSLTNEPPI